MRCSDEAVHRRRLAQRSRDIPGFPEPAWADVVVRRDGFTSWTQPRLVLDSMASRTENLATALAHLATLDAAPRT